MRWGQERFTWEHQSSQWTDTAAWLRTADQEEGWIPAQGESRKGRGSCWSAPRHTRLGNPGLPKPPVSLSPDCPEPIRHMKEGKGVSNTYGLTAFCEATAWAPPCHVESQPHMAASQTATIVLVLGRFQRWVGDRLVAAMVGSQLGLGPHSWDPKGWKSLTRPPGPDKRNLWPRGQRQNPRTTSSGKGVAVLGELWIQNPGPGGKHGCGRGPGNGKEPPWREQERERQLGGSLSSPLQGCTSEPPATRMRVITYQLTPLYQQSRSRAPGLCRGGERRKLG